MITRRQFIQGLAAALASAALPKGEQQEPDRGKATAGRDLEIDFAGAVSELGIKPNNWTLTESRDWSGTVGYEDWPKDFPLQPSPLQHTPAEWSAELVLDFDLELGREYPVEFAIFDQWWKGTGVVVQITDVCDGKLYSLRGTGGLVTGPT